MASQKQGRYLLCDFRVELIFSKATGQGQGSGQSLGFGLELPPPEKDTRECISFASLKHHRALSLAPKKIENTTQLIWSVSSTDGHTCTHVCALSKTSCSCFVLRFELYPRKSFSCWTSGQKHDSEATLACVVHRILSMPPIIFERQDPQKKTILRQKLKVKGFWSAKPSLCQVDSSAF